MCLLILYIKNRGGIETAKFLTTLIPWAPELVAVNAGYNFMPFESLLSLCSALKVEKGTYFPRVVFLICGYILKIVWAMNLEGDVNTFCWCQSYVCTYFSMTDNLYPSFQIVTFCAEFKSLFLVYFVIYIVCSFFWSWKWCALLINLLLGVRKMH